MLAIIPRLLPDETLYSYAKRCARYNHMDVRYMENIYMGGQRLHGDGLFYLPPLQRMTEDVLDDQLHALMGHTMYPLVSLYSRRIEQSLIPTSLFKACIAKTSPDAFQVVQQRRDDMSGLSTGRHPGLWRLVLSPAASGTWRVRLSHPWDCPTAIH